MSVDMVDSVTGAPVTQATEPNPSPESAPEQFTLRDGTSVSRDELLSGYMRQRDYTRKTQGLSQERQRVEAASQLLNMMETDPRGTLSQLAQYYGMAGDEPTPPEGEPEEPPDPRFAQLDQRLSQQESLAEQQLQKQADEYLVQQMDQVDQLAGQFGVEVDEDELFQFAYDNQLTDPVLAFYGLYGQELPERSSRKVLADYSAKRGLPVSRQGLSAPQPGAVQRPKARSLREALSYAMEDAGVQSLSDLSYE